MGLKKNSPGCGCCASCVKSFDGSNCNLEVSGSTVASIIWSLDDVPDTMYYEGLDATFSGLSSLIGTYAVSLTGSNCDAEILGAGSGTLTYSGGFSETAFYVIGFSASSSLNADGMNHSFYIRRNTFPGLLYSASIEWDICLEMPPTLVPDIYDNNNATISMAHG